MIFGSHKARRREGVWEEGIDCDVDFETTPNPGPSSTADCPLKGPSSSRDAFSLLRFGDVGLFKKTQHRRIDQGVIDPAFFELTAQDRDGGAQDEVLGVEFRQGGGKGGLEVAHAATNWVSGKPRASLLK
jgi:hypothetical protein